MKLNPNLSEMLFDLKRDFTSLGFSEKGFLQYNPEWLFVRIIVTVEKQLSKE